VKEFTNDWWGRYKRDRKPSTARGILFDRSNRRTRLGRVRETELAYPVVSARYAPRCLDRSVQIRRCHLLLIDTLMGLCSDRWITRMAREHGMIEPFEDRQVRQGVISYGVSSYGYDMRVASEYRIFTNALSSIVDPKQFDPKSFVEFEGDVCIVPPNSFALARSVEYFRIPRNVLTLTVGKSTYARCGIITNVTPFEPEWEGYVTLEISNTTPLPAKIYSNEGIAQVVFLTGDEDPEVSYGDKKGKYQGQHGVTLPRI
jgi:dCTP deaminase